MRSGWKYLLVLCAAMPTAVMAEPMGAILSPSAARVMLGDITDNRTTGQFFAGLRMEMRLSGDGIFEAYGISKPKFTSATDDTGRVLLKDDKNETLLWEMQPRQQKVANETLQGELANPARKATSITVKGYIQVYTPSLDPSAVVTIPDIQAVMGRPMESKEPPISITILDKAAAEADAEARKSKAASLQSALGQMFTGGRNLGENDLQFKISDPSGLIVKLEVIGANGKPIETGSRSKSSSDGIDNYVNSYKSPITKDTSLKIYYSTQKSMNQVPFSFENVPLP